MSDYFERIEAQLLDAVERQATQPRRRAWARARRGDRRPRRIALATVTAICVLVALAVAVALPGSDQRDDATMAPAGSLPALMEVLRRPQQPGDAPASVVRAARAAAARAPAPYAGTVDESGVRRLTEAVGHRLYLAALADGKAALAILTDSRDRPVQRPYGLTPRLLGTGAFYLLYGVRAVGDEPKDLRMLQLQLVPDGITRIDYRFPAVPFVPGRHEHHEVGAMVTSNTAVVLLRGHEVGGPPMQIDLRAAPGGVVQTAVPPARGRGPVAPEAVCRGVDLPRQPRRHPHGMSRLDARGLCRQLGLPQQAYQHDVDVLVLRYGDRVYTTSGGRVNAVQGRRPGDPFPPPLARGVPSTAVKLPR